jgi:hypothetical protein
VDNNFCNFASILFDTVSESDMQRSIPVETRERETMHVALQAASINWCLHMGPYLASLDYFEREYERFGYEKAGKLFEAMSMTRKTIIKRGYQIQYENKYPQLEDGAIYHITLAVKAETRARDKFPAGRILKNRTGEFYVR